MADPNQPLQAGQPIPAVQPVLTAQPIVTGPDGRVVQTGRPVCHCAYCRIHALFGPIMIICVGAVFLVAQYSYRFSFGDLWPVLLIVAGILKVAEALAPREGHIAS